MVMSGYAGNILMVDLSSGEICQESSAPYTARFLGGRGMAAKIYWDRVDPRIDAFAAENHLIFATGPLCGFPGFAGSRWQVCGKSPLRNQFSYANFGGPWGIQLKLAGYDGLIVTGKADFPVYLIIDNNNVEIKSAQALVGKGAISTRNMLKAELGKSVRIITNGPAGENRVRFATLLTDDDSSGAGGFGAVFGAKNLKAIAVRGNNKVKAADPGRLDLLRKELRQKKQLNFFMEFPIAPPEKLKKRVCQGCIKGCWRADYLAEDGQKGKFMCQSAVFYNSDARSFFQTKKTDVPFKANRLCDEYGVDSRVIHTMIEWLKSCYHQQKISDHSSGLLLSKIGSLEFIEDLLTRISFRKGFGNVLADGTRKAATYIGNGSDQLITDYMALDGELEAYGPRIYPLNGLFYATEPRQPIQHLHEISLPVSLWACEVQGIADTGITFDVLKQIAERFWGSEDAADFSTSKGKALAAVTIQNRQYLYESLILCNFSWPMSHIPGASDPVGDPTLESRIYGAVVGKESEEMDLYETGERIFNLQRAILVNEGWNGRQDDILAPYNYTIPIQNDVGNKGCLVPGKDGTITSHKGRVVERDEFERLKNEYYIHRGWDEKSGFQREKRLLKLDLKDIVDQLKNKELIAPADG